MMYTEKYFYLCRVPLSAAGSQDVDILQVAETTEQFPELFSKYEEMRAHAFNKDGLYSAVRADDMYCIVRTSGKDLAKQQAFDDSKANLVTNLQHRVMQQNDKNAKSILSKVHEIETDFSA
jgi:hypothetical protein